MQIVDLVDAKLFSRQQTPSIIYTCLRVFLELEKVGNLEVTLAGSTVFWAGKKRIVGLWKF